MGCLLAVALHPVGIYRSYPQKNHGEHLDNLTHEILISGVKILSY